jgi:hypothetical protein
MGDPRSLSLPYKSFVIVAAKRRVNSPFSVPGTIFTPIGGPMLKEVVIVFPPVSVPSSEKLGRTIAELFQL